MGDGGLVAEVPADCTRLIIRSPVHLLGAEIGPQVVGVAECSVVLDEEFSEPATG